MLSAADAGGAMFEAVELGATVDEDAYDEEVPRLRHRLLQAQMRAREAQLPVFVILAGVDKAGKGELLNLLNEWMDPRWLATLAYDDPSPEERERPHFWRYWRDMPAAGRLALYLSAWYRRPLKEGHRADEATFLRHVDEATHFEEMLLDGGALVLKFWIHLSRDAHERRLQQLAEAPAHSWRVTDRDWAQLESHDAFVEVAERVIARSHTPRAPWILVDGSDRRHRALRVGRALAEALEARLEAAPATPALPRVEPPPGNVLDRVDLSPSVDKPTYKEALHRLQGRLGYLQRLAFQRGVTTVAAFEGWDAGGKGGAIRRVTRALDARQVRVIPVAAPTDEELARHYLWRFWRRLPRAGRVLLFDRSWYGRVLVERVEGLATEAEWQRAYREINDFEAQLVDHGVVLSKFWLHISKDEQKKRFEARRKTPHKRWKLTAEDERNRKKWADHAEAVHEMVTRTSTPDAPWTLVAGDDKRSARLQVLRTLCARLAQALGEPTPDEEKDVS